VPALVACAPQTLPGSGYCAPPSSVRSFAADPTPPGPVSREELTAALLGLHALFVEAPRDDAARLRIATRLEEARILVASTRAELDCAEESARQLADYLTRSASTITQATTIASIVTAAATGIVSTFLSVNEAPAHAQEGFAIGGGVVVAGLGAASLSVHPRATVPHERNLLADVWTGPKESAAYPPVVWGYLTQPALSNEQRVSIREKIVGRWRGLRGIGDDPRTAALLFGSGGPYDAETLRTRAAMLADVKAEVDLMNQDLAALAAQLFRHDAGP
jgi:hypothetical protein